MNIRVLTVVGARPQFIKAAPVSRELRKKHQEILVHTGQHYDKNMSSLFFDELNIPDPDYNLGIGSSTHGDQTGRMLMDIEGVIMNENPDCLLVYGDTNSTLAGALAASKWNIPVIHVEAGLRSYNKRMPEEQNRVLTDHISSLLFCPTETAVENLKKEGITGGVYNVGDVMYDSVLYNTGIAREKSSITAKLGLESGEYYLVTVHRPQNTDNREKLLTILDALDSLDRKAVFPIHPRTSRQISEYGRERGEYSNIIFIQPVSYLDMLLLIDNCRRVLTDSGGLQKEAYFLKKPCITLREETEWIETVKSGFNKLVEINKTKIIEAALDEQENYYDDSYFGDGNAADKIIEVLTNYFMKS